MRMTYDDGFEVPLLRVITSIQPILIETGMLGDTVSNRFRRPAASSSIQNLEKPYLCAPQNCDSVMKKFRIIDHRSRSGSARSAVPSSTRRRDSSTSAFP